MEPKIGKELIFETQSGEKHLGYFDLLVNPTGDYRNPDDTKERFLESRSSKAYAKEDIVSWRYVEVKFFYRESADSTYVEFVQQPEQLDLYDAEASKQRMQSLFDTCTDCSKWELSVRELMPQIKQWLLFNAEIPSDVYVDEKFQIHIEGKIRFNSSSIAIPGYIRLCP